jgi:predicted ATP-binding protein involved in virulence
MMGSIINRGWNNFSLACLKRKKYCMFAKKLRIMAIEKIHEAVLTRLLNNKDNKEPLRFSLRTRNKRNDERLSKGYWFLGNDSYLIFSFWEGSDWRNKTPNIFFGINAEGKCWLEVVDNNNTEKARFFEDIAPIIGLVRFNSADRFQWRKSYNIDDNYLNALEEFLKKDKSILDAFIQAKGKQELFPLISETVFKENFDNVQEWREKIKKDAGCTLTVSEIKVTDTYPIRLKSLILDNIGHFKHIELKLDKQVICLIGENGSGKTSILRAIALGLAGIGDETENTVIDVSNIHIQEMLRINKIEGNEEVFASSGQINLVYNDNQEKNNIYFEFIKGEGVNSKGKTIRNYVKPYDLGSDLTATSSNNEFVNLVIGFSQIKSLPDEKDKFSIEESKTGRISEVTSLIYKRPDYSFDSFSKWIIQLWDINYKKEKRAIRLKVLKQIFKVIEQIVGGHFEFMPMKEDQKEIFIKTQDAPNGISINLISQGYNNVIGWVGYFMQRLWEVTPEENKANFQQTPAVCLIDEIDTYLHPKWEKTILGVLAEEFPNTQFVVTTHSPLIITHLKNTNNTAAIYHVSEQGIKQIQASGQDISTAMLMHFGIERRPIFYQNQIDKLFSNIEKFEENSNGLTIEILEKQLTDLKKILGNSDPDVETAERILETLNIPID